MLQAYPKLNVTEKAFFLSMLQNKQSFHEVGQAAINAINSNDPQRPKMMEWLEDYFSKLIRQTENPLAARLLVVLKEKLDFSKLADWFILWFND